VYPSSQIYSSLNLVIEFSHELMMRKEGAELLAPQAYRPPSANALPSN
jgi:hypothetical protein